MDPDYGPCKDYESALDWLEERGNFVKGSWIVKTFTPQEVARRVKAERMKDSTRVFVKGYDTSLPDGTDDTDIRVAMTKHFSSCGEIIQLEIPPLGPPVGAPGYHPNNSSAVINILGKDAKEKAEQLNGSVLLGCKLHVAAPNTGITLKDLDGELGKRITRRSYRGGSKEAADERKESSL